MTNKNTFKICIYKVEEHYDDPSSIIPSSWEEVNEEELENLKNYCKMT